MFITFRAGSPQFTFNVEAKKKIEEWKKKYLKIIFDYQNKKVIFHFQDEKTSFQVYSNSSWVKGVFPYGLASAETKHMLLDKGIRFQRLYVTADDTDTSLVFDYSNLDL